MSGGAARGRVRARAAARVGHLGRGGHHPPAGDAAGARRDGWSWRLTASLAAWLAGAVRRHALIARRIGRRAPGRSAVDRAPGLGGMRAGAGARQRPHAPRLADRAAGRLLSRRCWRRRWRCIRRCSRTRPSAKERLVATTFGPQAASQREDLQRRLQRGGRSDRRDPVARRFVVRRRRLGADDRSRASRSGRAPISATYRLTSAVELYSADGRLVSRVRAEPAGVRDHRVSIAGMQLGRSRSTRCRRSDRASATCCASRRGICVRGRMVGSIVVRVMLDYRTLPFISSQSPYLESLRPNRQVAPEGVSGRDVEFVVYGWSRAPIFESGTRVWTLPDAVFQRLVDSRDAVLGDARPRRSALPRLLPERPRRHLRARLSGHHAGSAT